MATRITDKLIKELAAPGAGPAVTFDSEIKGFGVRTGSGPSTFIMNYRTHGYQRRLTIGRYPAWSVAAARAEAKALRQRIDRGEDPVGARQDERAAPTVNDLCDWYMREHLPQNSAGAQREHGAMIATYIGPALGRKKVADVTIADCRDLHRKISRREFGPPKAKPQGGPARKPRERFGGPIRANRVLTLVSTIFKLAVIEEQWRSDNPARGVAHNPEHKRERFLSPAEIARLVTALNAYPGRGAAECLSFLLLTGARRGETMKATWGEIDLEAGHWHKPSHHTKQRRTHIVPLSGPARQLLHRIRPKDAKPDEPVFPGRFAGESVKQINTCWRAVTKAANIDGARIHDLRHSYASLLVSAGLSLPVIGALLGHTNPTTTSRYAHLMDDPLRQATERVGAIVTGGKAAEVVPLKRRT